MFPGPFTVPGGSSKKTSPSPMVHDASFFFFFRLFPCGPVYIHPLLYDVDVFFLQSPMASFFLLCVSWFILYTTDPFRQRSPSLWFFFFSQPPRSIPAPESVVEGSTVDRLGPFPTSRPLFFLKCSPPLPETCIDGEMRFRHTPQSGVSFQTVFLLSECSRQPLIRNGLKRCAPSPFGLF